MKPGVLSLVGCRQAGDRGDIRSVSLHLRSQTFQLLLSFASFETHPPVGVLGQNVGTSSNTMWVSNTTNHSLDISLLNVEMLLVLSGFFDFGGHFFLKVLTFVFNFLPSFVLSEKQPDWMAAV